MSRIRPEYLDAHSSDLLTVWDVRFREEPDKEEDEENDGEEEDDEDKEDDEGYSE